MRKLVLPPIQNIMGIRKQICYVETHTDDPQ
jgi:hypothetical protein